VLSAPVGQSSIPVLASSRTSPVHIITYTIRLVLCNVGERLTERGVSIRVEPKPNMLARLPPPAVLVASAVDSAAADAMAALLLIMIAFLAT